jgi:hypothetical protein
MGKPLIEAGVSDRIPVRRAGTADEIARSVVLLVSNAYMTGQTIAVNGGAFFYQKMKSVRRQRVLNFEQVAAVNLSPCGCEPVASSANPSAEADICVFRFVIVEARKRPRYMSAGQLFELECSRTHSAFVYFDERLSFQETSVRATMPEHTPQAPFGPGGHGFPQ